MKSVEAIAAHIGLDRELFSNPMVFITAVRSGVPGNVVEKILGWFDDSELFARALNSSETGLSNYCTQAKLSRQDSEIILDTVRTLSNIYSIWNSATAAKKWLYSSVPALGSMPPASFFDTFEGRRHVLHVTRKISYGEFS